jgi:hypothetical protein
MAAKDLFAEADGAEASTSTDALPINKNYAARFEHNHRRVELQKRPSSLFISSHCH